MPTYVWVCKEKEWKFWKFLSVWLKFSDLKPNDKWYVNLIISPRKEIGKYWETHSVSLDEFIPKAKEEPIEPIAHQSVQIEDIPF